MKRFLSLLMALTLVLALSACNSGTQPAPSSTAPPPRSQRLWQRRPRTCPGCDHHRGRPGLRL